jgi:hypothetical protein
MLMQVMTRRIEMGRWTAEDAEERRGCEFGGWMDGRVKSFFDAKSAKGGRVSRRGAKAQRG